MFAGRQITVPAVLRAGGADGGMHQVPGARAAMRAACPAMGQPVVVDGAGHRVQQERPTAVLAALLELVHS